MTSKQRDALNNLGFPQLTEKNSIFDFSKSDIQLIKKEILDCDKDFLKKHNKKEVQGNETRNILKNIVNSYCVAYRCYSLIIE